MAHGRALRDRGDAADDTAEGLRAIDAGAHWWGPAARAFHEKFRYEPAKWYDAADALRRVAALLDRYTTTLRWARERAAEAVALWSAGQAATERAAASRPPPAYDPGATARQDAQQALLRAREQLDTAGAALADLVDAEAEGAPRQRSWLDDAGAEARELGSAVGTGLASLGNAVVDHPGDLAALAGGAALVGISAAGEGAGIALDVTGVGAVAGVPVGVLSTAGIVTGGALVVASAEDLAQHAATDDRVEQAPPSRPPTKTDRLKEHLTDADLDAARRERSGEVVARKSDGTPWDHVTEVREAQNGLLNQINRLQRRLGDSRLSPDERSAAESELSEASRLLDYSERWVPRQ